MAEALFNFLIINMIFRPLFSIRQNGIHYTTELGSVYYFSLNIYYL
mgnify:CR=1